MNRDRIEGSGKQAKGEMKKTAGKILGDEKMKAEGRADKAEGKIQNTAGSIKDAAQDATRAKRKH